MRVRKAGLVIALAVLSVAGVRGAHPAPAAADTACPPIPATLTELMTAAEEIGPLTRDFRPIFGSYPERAAACFGDVEIAFDAIVASPEGLGGARSFRIEPLWLTGMAHFVAVEGPDAQGVLVGPFFPVAVPPALEQQFEDAWQLRVRVRGHFNDRVASSCIVVGGDPALGRVPTAREAFEICRTYFVVTSVEASAPTMPSAPPPSAGPTPTPSGAVGQPASSGASPIGLALIGLAVLVALGAGLRLLRGRRPR